MFDWNYEYGSLLLDKGRAADAVTVLGDATRVGDNAVTRPGRLYLAHLHYAQALQKVGRRPEAAANYQIYLDTAPGTDPDRAEAAAALKALGGPVKQ